MGHEAHHSHAHEEEPLGWFASPLHEKSHQTNHGQPTSVHSSESSNDIEHQKHASDPNMAPFENQDCELHESPAFHRHAEATTAELFYDLFFVANLTTFTSMLEINDKNSLTAYIGFFSLLWLTWYQVSLYDVRFSADSVFERIAKALHFGVMVGFAVIGPQWKPGQEILDYKIYRAFGLILMVSRLTLATQYSVTLFYTRKYKKTILPLCMIIASTVTAGILYGALTPAFPSIKSGADGFPIPKKSNIYIAWYIIGIGETALTVITSCLYRIISFKGTHFVQRMSLLTLIILGEGIIVICKSISKVVKNEFLWSAAVIGQIVSGILIIYFLYMLYFDRLSEEHFGSIKQQIWSFAHFPLHLVFVLALQGVSLLIVFRQAIEALNGLMQAVNSILNDETVTTAQDFVDGLGAATWGTVFGYVPKGVDASAAIAQADSALQVILNNYDYNDGTNVTAANAVDDAFFDLMSAASKTLFDSLSINTPKRKKDSGKKLKFDDLLSEYDKVFELVFMYVFLAAGFSLIFTTVIGFISLPAHKRRVSEYIRFAVNLVCGVGLCLVTLIKYNTVAQGNYLGSAWMVPTICIVLFVCVVVNHIRLPKEKEH
ncbi:hypothetical protein CC78DRAFT_541554 [Lojkania enalia]|uniref:Low temperature requirement A n=1 Tax=Lojkania enalia TaxID=147567 RepID=A0A9P4N6K6_9PLEO|nr:hypothetical protein CC78DRAFT_541554 [Didymosphaeria enalia]